MSWPTSKSGKSPGQIMFEALNPRGICNPRDGWKSWHQIHPRGRERWEEDALAVGRRFLEEAGVIEAIKAAPKLAEDQELGAATVRGCLFPKKDAPGNAQLDLVPPLIQPELAREILNGTVELHLVARPSKDRIRARLDELEKERERLRARLGT